MAHPRVGKRCSRGIRMALLAFAEQIFLERDACLGIIHPQNVMNTVTVGTDRFVRGLVGIILFEHFHSGAMEISNVCR